MLTFNYSLIENGDLSQKLFSKTYKTKANKL